MDSFKSSIPAYDACKIVANAIVEYLPHACIVIKPMAGGGEGTARAMIEALNGQLVAKEVMGPLESMEVKAAKITCKAKVPVAVLAGSVGLSKEEYENFGIADAISVKKDDMSLDYAIANSEKLLAEAALSSHESIWSVVTRQNNRNDML